MDTISIRGHFDGEQIRLDEPIELEPNTQLVVTILPNDEHAAWLHASACKLQDAYGDDEPEYPLDLIQEANTEYEGR